jgi:hypothetical protein
MLILNAHVCVREQVMLSPGERLRLRRRIRRLTKHLMRVPLEPEANDRRDWERREGVLIGLLNLAMDQLLTEIAPWN